MTPAEAKAIVAFLANRFPAEKHKLTAEVQEAWATDLEPLDGTIALAAARGVVLRDSPFFPSLGELVAEMVRMKTGLLGVEAAYVFARKRYTALARGKPTEPWPTQEIIEAAKEAGGETGFRERPEHETRAAFAFAYRGIAETRARHAREVEILAANPKALAGARTAFVAEPKPRSAPTEHERQALALVSGGKGMP